MFLHIRHEADHGERPQGSTHILCWRNHSSDMHKLFTVVSANDEAQREKRKARVMQLIMHEHVLITPRVQCKEGKGFWIVCVVVGKAFPQ